ncbi:MAG: hypothetical protein C4554_09330 [Dethiobacter sp.]|nr:MAG: hypothetical protein C4554_09330 [Dethiobacter sp.]
MLQSAGIIEYHSLGPKGSIIRITNSYLLNNLGTFAQQVSTTPHK